MGGNFLILEIHFSVLDKNVVISFMKRVMLYQSSILLLSEQFANNLILVVSTFLLFLSHVLYSY